MTNESMKRMIDYAGRALYVVVIYISVVLTGCTEGLLGPVTGGESQIPDGAITNTSGGVALTVSLTDITESSALFEGKAILSQNYTADSFGILYSQRPIISASEAINLPITDIYGDEFSVCVSSLKPATKYYYTSYIKHGSVYNYGPS